MVACLRHGHIVMAMGEDTPGRVAAQNAAREVAVTQHPRERVASLAELEVDRAIEFEFPEGHQHAGATLVKLGTRAGGGVGPEQDVVAFSTRCTHMGGNVLYNAAHKLGACKEHRMLLFGRRGHRPADQ